MSFERQGETSAKDKWKKLGFALSKVVDRIVVPSSSGL
jgi:hypothetical protein